MLRYRCLFFISILFTCHISWANTACQKDLRILYGPFVSESYIRDNLSPVHLEIQRLSQCKVSHSISHNYVVFHQRIKQREFDIVFIASAHLPYITPWQYQRVASGMGPIKITVFGKKAKNIFSLEDLIGKRLLLNGETSIAGLAWDSIAAKNSVDSNRINIVYTVDTNTLLMNLLKGEAEGAVTFNQFYRRLPSSLQDKLTVIDSKEVILPASIVVNKRNNPALINTIKTAFHNDKHWEMNKPKDELPVNDKAHKILSTIFDLNKKQ